MLKGALTNALDMESCRLEVAFVEVTGGDTDESLTFEEVADIPLEPS